MQATAVGATGQYEGQYGRCCEKMQAHESKSRE
jgi:hypothetical protein